MERPVQIKPVQIALRDSREDLGASSPRPCNSAQSCWGGAASGPSAMVGQQLEACWRGDGFAVFAIDLPANVSVHVIMVVVASAKPDRALAIPIRRVSPATTMRLQTLEND